MYSTTAYLYQQIIRVLLIDTSGGYFTARYDPVYAKTLTVNKGVDNVLLFEFINQDQKPVNITGSTFRFRLLNQTGDELLLEKDYEVHGIIRRTSTFNTDRIDHIFDKLKLHYGDVTDPLVISNLISQIHPDEVYNLAAQSHVKVSFEVPEYTANVNGLSVLRFLEAIRQNCPEAKFYQAGTSEMFGNLKSPQLIQNGFSPQSPYASAKCFAHSVVENYRNAYGLHATNGVVFNHESPRRGKNFVTKKIVIRRDFIK